MDTNDVIKEAQHRIEEGRRRQAAKSDFLHAATENVNAMIFSADDNGYFKQDDRLSVDQARAALGIELIQESILRVVRASEWELAVSDISRKLELDRDSLAEEHKTWLVWDMVRRLLAEERLYRFPGSGRSYLFGTSRAPHMNEERFREENCGF